MKISTFERFYKLDNSTVIQKEGKYMVTIKSKREIELMKEACRVVALTYEE